MKATLCYESGHNSIILCQLVDDPVMRKQPLWIITLHMGGVLNWAFIVCETVCHWTTDQTCTSDFYFKCLL